MTIVMIKSSECRKVTKIQSVFLFLSLGQKKESKLQVINLEKVPFIHHFIEKFATMIKKSKNYYLPRYKHVSSCNTYREVCAELPTCSSQA